MPFSKNTSSVIYFFEHFCKSKFRSCHNGSTIISISYSCSQRIPSRHQAGSGGSTNRRDMKIIKTYTFFCKSINSRSYDIGVFVDAQIAIALVISDNQNDIWRPGSLFFLTTQRKYSNKKQNGMLYFHCILIFCFAGTASKWEQTKVAKSVAF